MIGLDTNVIVRYLAQDDARQAAIATRLFEKTLSADSRGFISVVTLAEVVWVMATSYATPRETIVDVVERLLTAPQLTIERADIVWRAVAVFRDSRADFSDALIAALGIEAGCSTTVTFDRRAAVSPGFEALK